VNDVLANIFFTLILSPYILIPVLVSRFVRSRGWKGYTYAITAVIIFVYPFAFIWLTGIMNPPPEGPRCMTGEASWVFVNIFFFLPLTMLFQWISNLIFFRKKFATTLTASETDEKFHL
jgi:hypothetical protein